MVLWLALGSRRRFWEQAFTFGSMVLTNAVGQIWFAQVVVYPLFTKVGEAEYVAYHKFYSSRIPLPVSIKKVQHPYRYSRFTCKWWGDRQGSNPRPSEPQSE